MDAFESAWAEFEQSAGPALADELSNQAPVGDPDNDPAPGTLAGSMVWEDQEGTLTVGSRDPRGPIAAYVTRGSSAHPIDPVYATYLHFFVGGDEVFAKHVEHPGTIANPFHVAAWEAQRDAIHQEFRDTVGGGVALSFLNPWQNRTLGEE